MQIGPVPHDPSLIAFFMPSLKGDGAERVMIDLAANIGASGRRVDMVVFNRRFAVVDTIGPNVDIVSLERPRTALAGLALYKYLRRSKPSVLMCTVENANILAAIVTRFVPGVRLVLREASSLMGDSDKRKYLDSSLIVNGLRYSYRKADAIIAVSSGIAEQVAEMAPSVSANIHVIPNPVLTERAYAGAKEPLAHPWFTKKQRPVVLAVGRLVPEKGFDTLLRAFAYLRAERDAKLIILGEGPLRSELTSLAKELEVEPDIDLPGYIPNPFPYMAGADMFVLSSRREGLPNVLIQGLAMCGNVVATDCKTGPREILDDGEFGRLVPVDDPQAMARAMLETLDSPMTFPPDRWYARYDAKNVTEQYLRILAG